MLKERYITHTARTELHSTHFPNPVGKHAEGGKKSRNFKGGEPQVKTTAAALTTTFNA